MTEPTSGGPNMKTKTLQSLHDVYYLIILDYDDGPNYVVVPHQKQEQIGHGKDLTTMARLVTRDPTDHCGSNDENLITRLQPIIWLYWTGAQIDYIKSHCDNSSTMEVSTE